MPEKKNINLYINDIFKKKPQSEVFLHNKFSVFSDEDIQEVYCNSALALSEKIHRGELTVHEGKIKIAKDGRQEELKTSLLSYFNSICWYQGLKYLRDNGRTETFDTYQENTTEDAYSTEKLNELLEMTDDGLTGEQRQLMREIVQDLPHPCEEILWSYYGDDMSMKEIALLIGYNGSNSVKSKKHWCIEKLKLRFEQSKAEFYDRQP